MSDQESRDESNPVYTQSQEQVLAHQNTPPPSATPTTRANASWPASPHSSAPGTPRTRPTLLDRISFRKSKGLKELALEDLEKRHQADKVEAKARTEAEVRERKSRNEEESQEQERKRKESRERAKRNKEERLRKQAQEKAVKNSYGIRGFDPDAGTLRSNRERLVDRQNFEHDRIHQGTQAQADRRLRTGETWGLEHGRPKQHDGKGHYSGEHGNCGEHYGSGAKASR